MEIGGSRLMLDYIRQRGYVSFSSLKNLRDGGKPGYTQSIHFDVGAETHSRWLEKKKIKTFDKENEEIIQGMVKALDADKVASAMLINARVEVEFTKPVYGYPAHGFIDIYPPTTYLGDLKTTKCTDRASFIKSMDFLQAALYMHVEKKNDFHYIGVCKIKPHPVFTFKVSNYPSQLDAAKRELKNLMLYVNKKI